MTFSIVHMSTTVVFIFDTTNFSTHSSQHNLSTITEVVDTIGRESRFLPMANRWYNIIIMMYGLTLSLHHRLLAILTGF